MTAWTPRGQSATEGLGLRFGATLKDPFVRHGGKPRREARFAYPKLGCGDARSASDSERKVTHATKAQRG